MKGLGSLNLRRVCVFCGSSPRASLRYQESARELGALLAQENLALVYGGAQIGLMGVLADSVLHHGGEAIGVIPKALVDREIAHRGLTQLYIVDSMHQRKALMADLADAFIALPGGLGTLEEFCEVLTWSQLGLHRKPCGMLNVNDYFRYLLAFLDHAVEERFFSPENRAMILVETEPQRLLERLRAYRAPMAERWITGREI
ncbi:MAG: TIGR00730 family Rossman fold protein [Syntrophomonadaceae bacterium]|nr:TIGR00730 family Rossman fold protein [Syntrophomonadaceae bacterium]